MNIVKSTLSAISAILDQISADITWLISNQVLQNPIRYCRYIPKSADISSHAY